MSCLVNPAFSQEFNIEDDSLSTLPPAALTAVRAHAKTTDYRDCADGGFIGTAIALAGGTQKLDWVAKTADGCAWGAATAAIWVLKHEGNAYRVVLYSGGQALNLKGKKSHMLKNLEITSATAGHYSAANYQYDGKRYQQFKARYVDLSDPRVCKKNPDVCPAK
ncbi:hypothetical protein ACO0LC_18620 [Undibacterium sp. JH2W]|uniref:hypothetical protein n=1 Tax=Undibacterium sp. JH2W TaxID=3413037 RepID=UPI003BF197D2